MKADQTHPAMLISKTSPLGVVVGELEQLPSTLLSTLAKALPHAVCANGYLLLPVDCIRIELRGGTSVTGQELAALLLSANDSCVRLVLWKQAMRGFGLE
ncbi:MAG TPA: hypothetical protein PKE27_15030 [Povalibacter sp.]|uniref:hypothetical protein n=1 Tax=Povalibacter sp. TaxID=1962978 RepID=UPI002B7B2295|nr:hypothetical protein [Povalibacter sp.]HMN45890.1 hypothetical protein [Povalibacter sp.]